MKNKGQSEMVGFGVILMIVTVLIMVFLSFSVSDKNDDGDLNSHKVKTFLGAFTEVTTSCEGSRLEDYLSLQKVISRCNIESFCYDGVDACVVMNETIDEIMQNSWKVGKDYPVKGYILELKYPQEDFFTKEVGVKTRISEGAILKFPSDDLLIQLVIYS